MKKIGALTGMQAEADCLRRLGGSVMAAACGGLPDRAGKVINDLIASGADRLISFGVAGGLDPRLAPGDLIIADEVLGPDGTFYPTDRAWRNTVVGEIKGKAPYVVGRVAGVDRPLLSAADKSDFREKTLAVAIDMESHHVALAAATAGLPMLAVRAIADPASQSIPEGALAGLDPDGRTRALPVLRALLRRPGDLPALLALARDSRKALIVLGRIAPSILA